MIGKSDKRTDDVAQSFVLPFRRVPQCEPKTIFRFLEINLPPVVKRTVRQAIPIKKVVIGHAGIGREERPDRDKSKYVHGP
jgi:hypothetical protein